MSPRSPLPHRPQPPTLAPRPVTLAVRGALLALMLAAGHMPSPSAAQTPPAANAASQRLARYDIAAGPLDDALTHFASQAGISIAMPPALVANKRSTSLSGAYAVDEGLARLLAGTGLVAASNGQTYVLKAEVAVQPPAAGDASGARQLATVTVTSHAERSAATENTGAYASGTVSLAKGQDVREIPQSVSVVTRQQMDDQNMVTLDQVMAYMPGITTGGLGLGGRGNAYYTRGLSANNVQLDGVADSGLVPGGLNLEGSNIAAMAMYDHVEVLRGADGLYGGLGDSSGTINMVRKRPLRDAQAKFNATAGSWDTYQTEADLTGPLALDGKLRGRIVLARKDARYFTDHARSRNDLVYAIGELDLGERTTATVGGHYSHERGTPQGGELSRNSDGSDPGLSRSTSLVAPWSTFTKENTAAFAELRHDFNTAWQAHASVNYARTRNSRYYAVIGQATDNANIRLRGGGYPGEDWSWDLNLKGQGELFGHAYDVLLGTDGRSHEMDYDFRWHFTYAGDAYNRAPIADPRHVDWSLYPRPLAFARDGLGHLSEAQRGAYGRLKLALTDDLHLVFGGRYARYEYRYTNTGYDAGGQQTSYSDMRYDEGGIFTPYAGLIYDLDPDWTAYGSVAKIFRSQAGYLTGPAPGTGLLDPLEGRNYEIGVKGDLGGRFTTAVALYRLERTGQAVFDSRFDYASGDQGWCCYINKGEVVSQGIDAEIQGELLPRLQVSASYVYNSIHDKTDGEVAYNTTVAPKHLLKLWSRYQLPGEWSPLSLGGGVTAQSRTYAEGSGFYYQQGGYALLNLFAQYQLDRHWQLGLNLNNVFNRKYYAAITDPTYGNYYGEPFNWTLSLRGTF